MSLIGRIAAQAARDALIKANSSQFADEILKSQTDENFFCEWCFSDPETGKGLVQARHHRQWQTQIKQNNKVVMWWPIEHGKTTQARMSLCRILGRHPERQYAYISSKQEQAVKQIGAVKREIESNRRLKMVYPKLGPQKAFLSNALEEWGKTRIRVAGCPAGKPDPSLAAYGLDGQILGARLHGAVLDNILDRSNTTSEDQRAKTLEIIQDEIMGRILPGGFIWILDTAWYDDDALHVLSKRPGWYSIKFDAEVGHDGDDTLWPLQFPKERLTEKLGDLGQTAFDRQFRNRPLSESMDYFKREFWDAAYGRTPWICPDEGGWPKGYDLQLQLVTGVDLATKPGQEHDLTSFSTILASGHRRKLIHLWADRIQITQILRKMVWIYRALHYPVIQAGGSAKFVVEDNAAQVYVVDMLKDASFLRAIGLTQDEAADIHVEGRTTTSKRRDEQLGVPGIAAGLEMGRWDIAANAQTQNLREEMRVWTPDAKHYGDRLMSLWIGNSGFQETGTDDWQVDVI